MTMTQESCRVSGGRTTSRRLGRSTTRLYRASSLARGGCARRASCTPGGDKVQLFYIINIWGETRCPFVSAQH